MPPLLVNTVQPSAFHRVPRHPADGGQLEPPVGLDLLDHGAQRVGVGGNGPRRGDHLPGPFGRQRPFAGVGQLQLRESRQRLLGEGDRPVGKAGGAGGVQQLG